MVVPASESTQSKAAHTSTTRFPQCLALLSGALGALASTFGKGAFGDHPAKSSLSELTCSDPNGPCSWILILTYRGLCLSLMLACNALMLGSFVQGMQDSGSVAGTALSNAANFVVSAVMGWLVFQEEYPSHWWIGFAMVLAGTTMLSTVRAIDIKRNNKSD